MSKKVGVILPIYKNDNPQWVKLSINSILTQTFQNFHLFIGVDGPISNNLRLCLDKYANNDKIEITYFLENRGLACVLNDLLKFCFDDAYEYIARMDADDVSVSTRFEKQVSFLEMNKEIDVVGGSINEIDEQSKDRNKIVIYPKTPNDCRRFFAKRNPHAHPAVMFRKSYFEKIGCLYRPEYRQNQDTMLWYDEWNTTC